MAMATTTKLKRGAAVATLAGAAGDDDDDNEDLQHALREWIGGEHPAVRSTDAAPPVGHNRGGG